MMKICKIFCVALASLALLSGCSKSDDGGGNGGGNGDGSVIGQWHLVSWSALSSADVYLSFSETGAFEIYQRVYSPSYVHYNGSYSFDKGVLSGLYSDGNPWGSSYKVTFQSNGTQMTLTSATSSGDVAVFVQSTIPDEILSGDLTSSPQSRSGEEPFRFL